MSEDAKRRLQKRIDRINAEWQSAERERLDSLALDQSRSSGVDKPIRISSIPYTKFEG